MFKKLWNCDWFWRLIPPGNSSLLTCLEGGPPRWMQWPMFAVCGLFVLIGSLAISGDGSVALDISAGATLLLLDLAATLLLFASIVWAISSQRRNTDRQWEHIEKQGAHLTEQTNIIKENLYQTSETQKALRSLILQIVSQKFRPCPWEESEVIKDESGDMVIRLKAPKEETT